MDDRQLLDRFVAEGSQEAFRELVERYLNFVYRAALRQVRDPHLAQDVGQMVFVNLARQAKSLRKDVVLAGWLHQDTRFTALDVLRAERRRLAREQQAVAMNDLNSNDSAAEWERLQPVLDEALDGLGKKDRDALLLRFFNQHSWRDVGSRLGMGEDAARKCVSRALEKLRVELFQRGITTTSAALAMAMPTIAAGSAPVGLAAIIASGSLAAGTSAVGGLAGVKLIGTIAMTKVKVATVSAVLAAGLAVPSVLQYRENQELQNEIHRLSMEAGEAERMRSEIERLTRLAAQEPKPLPNEQFRELLRLRGEVGLLREQLRQTNSTLAKSVKSRSKPENANDDRPSEQMRIVMAKESNQAILAAERAKQYQSLAQQSGTPLDSAGNPISQPQQAATLDQDGQQETYHLVGGEWLSGNGMNPNQLTNGISISVLRKTNSAGMTHTNISVHPLPID